jgi:hypothetical protein
MNAAVIKETWAHAWNSLQPFKTEIDVVSIGLTFATLISWLPHVTAVLTFAWTCIRLYETKTVQNWLARRRARKGA